MSTLALYVPTAPAAHERVGFEAVTSVGWAQETLTVITGGPQARRLVVRLDDPGEVPAAVRERVTASIALSEHVVLGPGVGARITARRVPNRDGLTWNVVFDPGGDPADPDLRALAAAAIDELRSSTGL